MEILHLLNNIVEVRFLNENLIKSEFLPPLRYEYFEINNLWHTNQFFRLFI